MIDNYNSSSPSISLRLVTSREKLLIQRCQFFFLNYEYAIVHSTEDCSGDIEYCRVSKKLGVKSSIIVN